MDTQTEWFALHDSLSFAENLKLYLNLNDKNTIELIECLYRLYIV